MARSIGKVNIRKLKAIVSQKIKDNTVQGSTDYKTIRDEVFLAILKNGLISGRCLTKK